MIKKLLCVFREDFKFYSFRLHVVQLLAGIFPPYTANRFRSFLLRWIGFKIGRGTIFFGLPKIVGSARVYENLSIGEDCQIGPECYFDLSGKIVIHDHTVLAPKITIMTGTHVIGGPANRAGSLFGKDVEIGDGVWICTYCTVLPGVKIGNGAILAAGAMVNKDVAENTMVGGVPAKFIRDLGDDLPQ